MADSTLVSVGRASAVDVRLLTHAAAATVFLAPRHAQLGRLSLRRRRPGVLHPGDPEAARPVPVSPRHRAGRAAGALLLRRRNRRERWCEAPAGPSKRGSRSAMSSRSSVLYAGLWRLGHHLFKTPHAPGRCSPPKRSAIASRRPVSTRWRGISIRACWCSPSACGPSPHICAAAPAGARGHRSGRAPAPDHRGLLRRLPAAGHLGHRATRAAMARRLDHGSIIVGMSWLLLAGPLAERARRRWTRPGAPCSTSKDYLFPGARLGPRRLGGESRQRGPGASGRLRFARPGDGRAPREQGLLAGAVVLTLGFLVTLPAVTAGSAFLVQLQISRVFWILDLLGVVSVLWLLLERDRQPADPDAPAGTRAVVALLCSPRRSHGAPGRRCGSTAIGRSSPVPFPPTTGRASSSGRRLSQFA